MTSTSFSVISVIVFTHDSTLSNKFSDIEGQNSVISKHADTKLHSFFFGIALNQSITTDEFFQTVAPVSFFNSPLILSY